MSLINYNNDHVFVAIGKKITIQILSLDYKWAQLLSNNRSCFQFFFIPTQFV